METSRLDEIRTWNGQQHSDLHLPAIGSSSSNGRGIECSKFKKLKKSKNIKPIWKRKRKRKGKEKKKKIEDKMKAKATGKKKRKKNEKKTK